MQDGGTPEQRTTRNRFLRQLVGFAAVGLGVGFVPAIARADTSANCCQRDCMEGTCSPGTLEFLCNDCPGEPTENCCLCLNRTDDCFRIGCGVCG